MAGGECRILNGIIATAADDSANAIGRFFRVRSNDCIDSLKLHSADASSAGAIDIGLYQTAENGGAVVDADFFASAVDLTGGPYVGLEVAFESGAGYLLANSCKPLWQAMGLTVDPGIEYDVAYTITTTFNGAGTVTKLQGLVHS